MQGVISRYVQCSSARVQPTRTHTHTYTLIHTYIHTYTHTHARTHTHTHTHTVELRLSERQSSETSNIRTHIFFVLRSKNENSAITSHNEVLCHFYQVLYFVCTVLHCNGYIILEKPLDLCTVRLLGSVIRTIDYPNYRWSQLVRIIDVLLYIHTMGYARTKVIGSRKSFVIASVSSSIQ